MQLKKIILVFKTHFDIGFTDLASNVIDNYAGEMLKEVIATCKGTQDMGKLKYVWTMPAWPLMHIVKNAAPELKKELDELIGNGQVVWHALPFTTHTDFCSQKEYLEGLKYSKQLADMYHKPCPVAAKMTDVPGHSIMLPDLLAQAGIRFLHLGCNEFATPPEVPSLFYWQAPGGRRVLTMYSKGGYGTGLIPPDGWKYPVWMALMHTHDNMGPQSADAIRSMAEEIRQIYPDVEVVCGSMDDFYRELAQCDLSDVPVASGDMADTWIHGVGAYPCEVATVRRGRRQMEGLQALWLRSWLQEPESQVLSGAGCSQEEMQRLLERYYEEIALFEEHTWGADVKTWMGPDRVYHKKDFLEAKKTKAYRFMEESWKEQRDRARQSEMILHILNGLSEPVCQQNGQRTSYLFHGSSVPYTGWVRLPKEWEGKNIRVDGRDLICERIGEDWCCYVTDLPGFVSVPIVKLSDALENLLTESSLAPERISGLAVLKDNTSDGQLIVENHRYRLHFCGKTGVITQLWDKKLQCSLLKQNGEKGIFTYQYDKYGYDDINEYLRQYGYHFTIWGIQDYGRENYPFCEHEVFTPAFDHYELDGNTIRFCYGKQDILPESAEKYGDAAQVDLEITLPAAGEELFLTLHLKDKQESPFVESGSLLFPLGEERMSYRMQKGGALLDPARDIVDKANHSLYCLENGMAAMGESAGICLKTYDAPLAALGGTGIYHFAPVYEAAEKPCIYVNLFNNMWGTNFPQWTGGDMSFQFGLSGICAGEERELAGLLGLTPDAVRITGNDFKEPMIKLPEQMKLIGIRPAVSGQSVTGGQSGADVQTAEEGILVQLADLSGEAGERCLTAKGCLITPVDLYGRAQAETAADSCVFEAAAYGVQNFCLKRS